MDEEIRDQIGNLPGAPDVVKQRCRSCGMAKPLTEEHWDRDRSCSANGGFKYECIACRNAHRRETAQRHYEYRTRSDEALLKAKIRGIEKWSFDQLDKMSRGGSRAPHQNEVFQRIMEGFGGPGGFALHYMAQFHSAPIGSSTRQKMLDTVVRLAQKCSESGGAERELEHMSTEDLEKELRERVRQVILKLPPGDIQNIEVASREEIGDTDGADADEAMEGIEDKRDGMEKRAS